MKLWKRWTAAVLAAAMALLLLAACGPSGPSAPDAPDTPGSSETGKDPTDEKTEEQKAAAVVDTLNTVRKNYGNNTPLELNEQACAFAKEMGTGAAGWRQWQIWRESEYQHGVYCCLCKRPQEDGGRKKGSIGVGALQGAYPDAIQFEKWADKKWKDETEKASVERNNALVKKEATLVGVGVVQNTDPATRDKYPIMVVVMTY